MPDASKQKELLTSWTQQESLVALGTGSYFLKQPQRLLPGLGRFGGATKGENERFENGKDGAYDWS